MVVPPPVKVVASVVVNSIVRLASIGVDCEVTVSMVVVVAAMVVVVTGVEACGGWVVNMVTVGGAVDVGR